MVEKTKLRAGKYMVPVTQSFEGGRIFFSFGFNRTLMAEIKSMAGAKWHGYDKPPRKCWSVLNNQRNKFQLEYLKGNNPYAKYDKPLEDLDFINPLYDRQKEMARFVYTRRQCILAAEMGMGKSLVAIETMEHFPEKEWWWVAPKSALRSTELELKKWKCPVKPKLLTYDKLRILLSQEWVDGDPAPFGVFLDESSRVKNRTAQRSQAAKHLADAIRDQYGDEGFVVLMTGTPAPRSPIDWYNQCEIACPGFLKEGTDAKFRQTMGLIVERESITGGVYPHLITWRDDPNKCNVCGEFKDHANHDPINLEWHNFEESVDEVSRLYRRMDGLVDVALKKDCLDLPDKIYRTVECKPTPSIVRSAKLIANSASSTIKALIGLRELSDGFQYKQENANEPSTCPACNGKACVLVNEEMVPCDYCGATGEVVSKVKVTKEVACPKIDAFIDLLDEYSEVGRLVTYAGFSASIDRLVSTALKQGWAVLKIDGRGWKTFLPDGSSGPSTDTFLQALDKSHPDFGSNMDAYPKLLYVGHPGSGGMGLTLTGSPAIIYYSNDFDAEARMQSEDRIHRKGMDNNRGATIIDLIHLPSDTYVLNNIKKKRNLQSQSLGSVKDLFGDIDDSGYSFK